MDMEKNGRELWEWQEEENCLQGNTRNEISHYLWDDDQTEDVLLYMLGGQTPIKDCGDLGYQISDIGDKENKDMEESRQSSQLKRRRILQFNSNDSDIGISDGQLASEVLKSKLGDDSPMGDGINESMQWILGFSVDSQEGLDQTAECWLESCFNESEMHFSANELNVSGASDSQEHCNVAAPQMKTVQAPVAVSMTPCVKFKGRKSCIGTPTKMSATVAYPFALIKPCGVQGDTTLNDINQRIHAPLLSKSKHTMDGDSSYCYPTSAFSGKPVVVKTKIRTEGGKGSITIMRTKG